MWNSTSTERAVSFFTCVDAIAPSRLDTGVTVSFREAGLLDYAHLVNWSFGLSSVSFVKVAKRLLTGGPLGWQAVLPVLVPVCFETWHKGRQSEWHFLRVGYRRRVETAIFMAVFLYQGPDFGSWNWGDLIYLHCFSPLPPTTEIPLCLSCCPWGSVLSQPSFPIFPPDSEEEGEKAPVPVCCSQGTPTWCQWLFLIPCVRCAECEIFN